MGKVCVCVGEERGAVTAIIQGQGNYSGCNWVVKKTNHAMCLRISACNSPSPQPVESRYLTSRKRAKRSAREDRVCRQARRHTLSEGWTRCVQLTPGVEDGVIIIFDSQSSPAFSPSLHPCSLTRLFWQKKDRETTLKSLWGHFLCCISFTTRGVQHFIHLEQASGLPGTTAPPTRPRSAP